MASPVEKKGVSKTMDADVVRSADKNLVGDSNGMPCPEQKHVVPGSSGESAGVPGVSL